MWYSFFNNEVTMAKKPIKMETAEEAKAKAKATPP
jgi:hypothetical protein